MKHLFMFVATLGILAAATAYASAQTFRDASGRLTATPPRPTATARAHSVTPRVGSPVRLPATAMARRRSATAPAA